MVFSTSDGVKLHYRIEGEDGLPVLVLSNGLGTELAMWDAQIPTLTRTFRVLRYDTRGHGGSSTSSQPFTLECLGRDVLALLDHVQVARAHFCGLSMGGMIGMWLGIHAPGRVGRLVLANTAARIGPPAMWNDRIGVVNERGMTAISDAATVRWFTPEFIARKPGPVAEVKAAMERTSAKGYVQCCAAIRDADLREAIAGIEASVLVICGAYDAATPPADGQFIAHSIADANSVTLDTAHLSNIEAPREFSEALLTFCSAIEVPRQ